MKIIEGDLWEEISQNQYDAILIPTNGAWNSQGEAIMGAGVAKQAKEKFPGIERSLGSFLKFNAGRMEDPQWKEPWNVPYLIGQGDNGIRVFSFPTKYTWAYTTSKNDHILGRYKQDAVGKKRVPGWQAKSDLFLIERSAQIFSEVAKIFNSIILPAVGTGRGELSPDDVAPILQKYFDNRYTVVVK